MFNFWALFVFAAILAALTSLIFSKNPFQLLLLSEFCWILLITITALMSTFYSDPRYFLFMIIFLFFAALEVVLYLITFIFKK